jgi:hypothetical protein
MKKFIYAFLILLFFTGGKVIASEKTRVIVTSDGEVDDECSLVRFLLYANEWDIEGIITSSSQYHWQGHKWAGDDWIAPYLDAYEEIYPNLILHDADFPSPSYLKEISLLGNVKSEGDMESPTAGSEHIVKVLLDSSDDRPIWLQAWGGTNTIARALLTIEEKHPDRMAEVAEKIRLFLIWEQDKTFQNYILPNWGKYQIKTIISDQFWALAYQWKLIQPKAQQSFLESKWMKSNILENHGPLCSMYQAHKDGSYGLIGDTDFEPGDFRSEGDSPAFLHTIPTGLRNLEHPNWGGWGGRYIKVRDNIWLDPVPNPLYKHPKGRWYTGSAWGRMSLRQGETSFNNERVKEYFMPMWRWTEATQNDFAARADWSVKPFAEANHPPQPNTKHALELKASPGKKVFLNAEGSTDPDNDTLSYRWWHYPEASTSDGILSIQNANRIKASFGVPKDAKKGSTIHIVLEVKDNGSPALTRYQRIVVDVI